MWHAFLYRDSGNLLNSHGPVATDSGILLNDAHRAGARFNNEYISLHDITHYKTMHKCVQ